MNSDQIGIDDLAKFAGEVGDPTPDQLLTGGRQLDRAADLADAGVVLGRSGRSPHRRRVVVLVAGVAAAGALLAVPLSGAPTASANQVLLQTAKAAGEQPDTAAGAAYWYVRSEDDSTSSEPFQREVWQGRTNRTIYRDQSHTRGFADSGVVDRATIRTEASEAPARFVVGGERLSWDQLDALPTNSEKLSTLLRQKVARYHPHEDNELWESITNMLRESPASPALRRALWEVAAGMRDVTLLGPMTDATGRRGTAIKRDETSQRRGSTIYILDPATGALLEWRQLGGDGRTAFRATELEQRPSATAPAAQPPLCGLGSQPEHDC